MNWKLWAGILISGLLLFFAARHVDIKQLVEVLKNVNYWYLLAVLFLNMIYMWLRAYRWHFLLRPVKHIPTPRLFSATMIGFMANNLFPARLGEVVRALAIGKMARISRSVSFATIVFERVLDGFTILTFSIILLLFSPVPLPQWLHRIFPLILIIYVLVLAFLIGLRVQTQRFMALFQWMTKPFPAKVQGKVLHIIRSFVAGLEILHDARNVIIAWFLSFLVWTSAALGVYFLMIAFNLHLAVYTAFFLQVILCLSVVIPSAPGYIGTIQFACVAGLAPFGVNADSAFSFSILYHAGQFIPITLIGLFFFFKEGFSFAQMKGSLKDFKESEEGSASP
jgi:uncharacterized protein (TIRG00374 family)